MENIAEKLEIVHTSKITHIRADVLVNAVIDDAFTEADSLFYYQLTREVIGIRRMNSAVDKYRGMSIGAANFLDVPDMECFKRLALVIFPSNFDDPFGLYNLYLCYRNALDRAAEENLAIVAFIDPSELEGIAKSTAARTAICTILHWLLTSPYREKISRVIIACSSAAAHHISATIRALVLGGEYTDPLEAHPDLKNVLCAGMDGGAFNLVKMFRRVDMALLEKILQAEVFNYWHSTAHEDQDPDGYEMERVVRNMAATPADFFKYVNRVTETVKGMTDVAIKRDADAIYKKIFTKEDGLLELQLSKMFHLQVIPIEEPDGRIRQYVFFYTSKRDGSHSFLCYKCKMLQESTGHRYRPVIKMLPDGSIMMGNIEHHPYCIPLTKTEVIFQQVNRAKRMLPAVPTIELSEPSLEG